ncbi:hypothetical protein LEA60_26340, partial [Salmonella enterica]|nr:hypothetical protein [Salmonella enterica]
AGQSHFLYNGALYSVSYDAAKDVTTYTPVSYDPSQKQSYSNLFYNSINSQTSVYISFLNNDIKELQKTKSIIDSYINSRHDDKVKYFNDYQSLINLSRVYSQLISAAQTDISKVNSLGINPSPVYLGSSDSQSYAIYTESNSGLCGLNYNYCDVVGVPLRIVYHNKDVLDALKKKYDSLPSSSFVYSKSETYVPYKPVFNVNSYSYFTGMDFFSNSANSYLNSARFGHSPPRPLPFMDFSQSVDDSDSGNPDTGDSGSGDTSVTPPGGGGTVTPPVTGGGGGGGSGGTDTPDTGSQCVPGSPGWPDCDDQSGQSGGGDSSGDSGSGGDKPGTGDSGGGGGGSGGGHGSGGDGHGGGDTDGDGDALLQEVKRFHADVNAALKPDSSAMPQFSDKDADFSDVQKDLDKQEKEQGEAWASGADKLKSTLGGISGSLPSTELDMSKAVPVGITGVCRPWEFDIVIGITDGKQFKQHVVMTQFCTWYDTYIRPFVTWAFNFLTAVAVFNILYKGLRTID